MAWGKLIGNDAASSNVAAEGHRPREGTVIEGQGFRFEPAALMTFADSTSRMVGMVTEARNGLNSDVELPAGIFGEVGDSSGFVTAFAERTRGMLTAVDAIGRGVDGLGTAVRNYCTEKLRQDEDTARDLQRAQSV